MEQLRRQRRQHKQLAAEGLGLSGRFDRIWANQVGGLLQDSKLAGLPPNPNMLAVQDPDGNDVWLPGLHPFIEG